MKHRRKFILIVLLVLVGVFLAGCGVPRGPVDPEAPPVGMWQTLVVFPLTEALLFLERFFSGAGMANSYGWAIIAFAILFRLILLPLTIRQMRSTKAMQALQPQLQELQKKYAKDREMFAQKQMELYREAGVSPLGGCLPMLIQFPIIFGLSNALYRLAGMGKLVGQPFFWIPDLSFPTYGEGTQWLVAAWKASDWSTLIAYLILPVLLVITQIVIQKMAQATTAATSGDGQQGMMNQMMLVMSVMFGYWMLTYPSGVALYWVVSNLLSLGQQYLITQRFGGGAASAPTFTEVKTKTDRSKIAAPAVAGDDLVGIKGIGHKTEATLNAAGITTFGDLAAADETQLTDIMEAADLPSGDYLSWIRQAGNMESS